MKQNLLTKIICVMFLFLGGLLHSQSISGTVNDKVDTLPGVNISVKGTNNGVQTDMDGSYTLNDVSIDDIIVFSYLGYKTQEVIYSGQLVLDITLLEDASKLDEIVVIGYGTTTVKDATGAVSTVSAKDFNQGAISSPEQLIQGKSAGVQITQSSGEPGAGIVVRIRGTGSARANNSPLFVIDGVPVSNESVSASGADIGVGSSGSRNPLNFLNPNDIESMSILKDASSTAIYGSRGANGVVIITTKSGRSAGTEGQFNFSSNVTMSETRNRFDLLSTDEFVQRGGADLGGAIDWQDFIFRTVVSTDTNLSYSRSYGKGNVRATVNYSDQLGIIEDTQLERITARVNANHRFLKDKLKVSFQGTFSRINDQVPFISRNSGSTGDLLAAAYYSNPTLTNNPDFDTAPDRNPANLLEYYDDNTNTNRFLGNLSLDYEITNEFSAKLTLGLDNSTSERGQVLGPQILAVDNGAIGNGRAAISNLDTQSQLLEFTVNYKKEFENSRLDALVGFSYQDFNRNGQNILGQGYNSSSLSDIRAITETAYSNTRNLARNYQAYGIGTFEGGTADEFRILNLFPSLNQSTAGLPSIPIDALSVDTFDNTDELQSFFGRVNYSIQDKYLFTATLRADGSSRFGPENQYGYFPSAAFAWKLNQEDFISEDMFSTLKMRLNWGLTGNQDGLGYGSFVNRTRWNTLGITQNSQLTAPANVAVADAQPDLRWEETTQFGFGIDFGFKNDRLSGSFDFYRKETRDLLLNSPSIQPAIQPFVFDNIDAVLINEGLELAIDYDIVRSDILIWNANFNIAYNRNELTEYTGPDLQAGNLFGQGLTGATTQVLTNGRSLFTYNLREVDGTEVAADPTILDKSGLPDFNAGLSTSVQYKNWDASVFFAGQFGHYVYNNTANALFATPQIGSRNNLQSVVDDGIVLSSTNPSTFFLEKGDFVRLQSAQISYNFPLSGEGDIQSLRVSASGQNLFLITGYSGLDPEVSTTNIPANGLPSASIDYLAFPRPRTFSLGVNVTF
ncbi:TonB-dependent outer membrane receptor channel protein, SusC family [Psychroflexus torquis ATCC 700755]|uniref:TonB-dependent outer membrane receptor channel protein, SusC family n=1 Tax=Psychroflexus torquis (strain ATCC 700755 / CIP 106069 / ACAM 623) TaxID=313595 RepID=K4IGP6_PSYTT|nr:SusC/RagA family TonB-linked outer membrane protein [Psychroflexus torquis]AFU68246.1 TonB-dependent outer membrane receptor channel protein, SusC family [Psychroflexus torquis ATCC 700755]